MTRKSLLATLLAMETNWILLGNGEAIVGIGESPTAHDKFNFLKDGGLLTRCFLIPSLQSTDTRLNFELTHNPNDETIHVSLYLHDADKPELANVSYARTFNASDFGTNVEGNEDMLIQWIENGVLVLSRAYHGMLSTSFNFDAMNAWVSESVLPIIEAIDNDSHILALTREVEHFTEQTKATAHRFDLLKFQVLESSSAPTGINQLIEGFAVA